jgi:hypothetical protein
MRYISSLLLAIFFPVLLSAQYFEVGALIGTSGYKGDLSDNRIATNEMNTALGVFGRYHFSKYFAAKANLTKYGISGQDANSRSATLRERNLSFRSDVVEFGLTGELNLMGYNIRDDKGAVPYLTAGLSFFKFNPQAQIEGIWHDLEPLHTEGTGYNKVGFALPLGIGFRFNVSYRVNFGLELGYRKTFTDRLDDVSGNYINVTEMRSESILASQLAYRTPELTGEFGTDPVGTQRGDSSNNDDFFYAALTVSVNLTDKYGLDFDEKYDIFKEPQIKTRAERAKEAKKMAAKKRKEQIKSIRKKLRNARKNKSELKAPAKKRTEKNEE